VGETFGIVDGDLALLVELNQMLIQGLHLVLGLAVLDVFLDLVEPSFADAGLNRGSGAHDLHHRQNVFAGRILDQAQGDGGNENVSQTLPDDLLGFGRKVADDAVDGRHRTLGV